METPLGRSSSEISVEGKANIECEWEMQQHDR